VALEHNLAVLAGADTVALARRDSAVDLYNCECGMRVEASDKEDHDVLCPVFPVTCPWCGDVGVRARTADHLLRCKSSESCVKCPGVCGGGESGFGSRADASTAPWWLLEPPLAVATIDYEAAFVPRADYHRLSEDHDARSGAITTRLEILRAPPSNAPVYSRMDLYAGHLRVVQCSLCGKREFEPEFDASGLHRCPLPLDKDSHSALYADHGRGLLSGILHFKLGAYNVADTDTFLSLLRRGASLEGLSGITIFSGHDLAGRYHSNLLRSGPGTRAVGLKIPVELQDAYRSLLLKMMLPILLSCHVPRDLVLMCVEYSTLPR
jgi:hypothetical protein